MFGLICRMPKRRRAGWSKWGGGFLLVLLASGFASNAGATDPPSLVDAFQQASN